VDQGSYCHEGFLFSFLWLFSCLYYVDDLRDIPCSRVSRFLPQNWRASPKVADVAVIGVYSNKEATELPRCV
jgi:hypothetical protein